MAKRFKSIQALSDAIEEQFNDDIGEISVELHSFVKDDIKSTIAGTLKIPTDPRLTKATGHPTPSDIAGAMFPKFVFSQEAVAIQFWHVPSLESASTPRGGGENIPIWSMLNWGSGPNLKFSSRKRAEWSVSRRFLFNLMNYVVPLKTRGKDIDRTMSAPPYDTTFGFVWWKYMGRGARGQGFYVPVKTVAKIEAARAKRGDKKGIETEPMQYYTAQHYIERSVGMMLGKMRRVFGGNKNLVSKFPIR